MLRQSERDEGLPILSWLGEPPRPAVAAQLAPIVTVVEGWDSEAAVVTIWFEADPRLLSVLPPPDQRPPVIAACNGDPQMVDRLEWIRAGAEDLVSVSRLIHTLTEAFPPDSRLKTPKKTRRLRRAEAPPPPSPAALTPSEPRRSDAPGLEPPGDSAPAPATPSTRPPPPTARPYRLEDDVTASREGPPSPRHPPTSGAPTQDLTRARHPPPPADPPTIAEPAGADRPRQPEALSMRSPALETPARPAASDPFPAIPVLGADTAPASLREWVHHASRYVRQRADFLAELGPGALDGFLAICHMREHLDVLVNGAGRSERFGRVGEGHPQEPSLGWPAIVRRLRSDDQALEMTDGLVLGAGTDGLVIEAGLSVAPKQRVLVDLPFAADVNAQVMLEARWQRPVARGRWQIGALIVEMRMAGF